MKLASLDYFAHCRITLNAIAVYSAVTPKPITPLLTVDCVIFAPDGRVVLIRRANEPFQGSYALPGGFVDVGETVEAACVRETREETGLRATNLRLIGVFSDPGRDPRGHSVAVAFLADADVADLAAGDDAASVHLVGDWAAHHLAFDHDQIITAALRFRDSR